MSAAEPQESPAVIHFGEFTLDFVRRGLYKGRERVRLTSKPLETLIFLVRHRGQVVEKQQLLDAVWKDTFVTEDTLVHAVREVRRALEDDKGDPRFIQTVPRQGYRFVGNVNINSPADAPPIPEPGGEAAPAADSKPRNYNLPTAAASKQSLGRRRWFAAAGAAVLIFVTFLRPWRLFGEVEHHSSTGAWSVENLRQMTSGAFSADRSSLSSGGEYLVYVSSAEDTEGFGDLFVKPSGEGSPIQITNRVDPASDLPAFTADGTHIVFTRDRDGERGDRMSDLWIVPIIGSIEGFPKVYLTEASGACFSPDGRWIAYTKHLGSGRPLRISPTNNLDHYIETAVRGFEACWSPDGKWLAYTTSGSNEGLGVIWIVPVSSPETGMIETSQPKQLTTDPMRISGLAWTPDSRSVIFSASRNGPALLWCTPITGGPPAALTSGVGDYAAPCVSLGGALITTQGHAARDIVLTGEMNGPAVQQITQDEYHLWPRLSPSGELVASVIRRPDFNERLYVTDLRTRKRTAMSDSAARHPCWLDDRTLAFLRDSQSGQTEACVTDLLNAAPRPLVRFSREAHWLAVHPNRKRFAAVLKLPDGGERIVLRDLDSREEELTIAEGSQYEQLRWLPDGSALSWSGPPTGTGPESNGIWKWLDQAGSQPARIVADGYEPVWSSDGKSLYFSRLGRNAGLYRLDLARRSEERVRAWRNVRFYDIAAGRMVYAQDSSDGQIYSMSLLRKG